MPPPEQQFRKTLLALGLVLGVLGLSLSGWRAGAHDWQLNEGVSGQGTVDSVAAILNADGTLRAERQGSFDARGYRMEYTASGAPRFVRAMQPADCNGWDTQFSLPNGTNGIVYALVVSGSDVYVGGDFTLAGNVAVNNVARFDTLTNIWSKLGTGTGNGVDGSFAGSGVFALAMIGSDLYVGGSFTEANVGGAVVSAHGVARFDTLTNIWSGLGSGAGSGVNGSVYALAVIGSDLYVGGFIIQANMGGTTVNVNNVARFNLTSNTWSALGSGTGNGVNSIVYALAALGSDLYVGGVFTQANAGGTPDPVYASRIAKFDTTTSTWSALGSSFTNGSPNQIYALAVIGSDLYAGGNFTFTDSGHLMANRVAKYDTLTSTWSKLGSGAGNGVSGIVYTLLASGNDLYVGGNFTQANIGGETVATNWVAKFDASSNAWSALGAIPGNGVNNIVRALAMGDSHVYVGGSFTQANVDGTAVGANNVAQFSTTTNTWSGLSSGTGNGVTNSVSALVVSGSDLYVGGDFTGAGNVGVNRVAKFNTMTNTWSALGSGVGDALSGSVRALAVSGSDLYVGGDFRLAGNVAANRVAKFNTLTNTWSALGSGAGNGVSGLVYALVVSGSDLYVGGNFTLANVGGTTVSANRVAKFNTLTNVWSGLGSGAGNGVNGNVYALAVIGSDLYVGGNFTQANVGGTTVGMNWVARFNSTTNTWSALGAGSSNGVNSTVYALAVSGSDLYVGGLFTQANVGDMPISARRIAKFDTTTSIWSGLDSGTGNGVNSTVLALAVSGNDVYVGGNFTQANLDGAPINANRVGRFNTTTNTWSALLDPGGGNGVDNSVYALAASSSKLYVGGFFNFAGDNKQSLKIAGFCVNTCSASLNKLAESFAANGGTGSFTVEIGAGCSWTAVSNHPFITITAPLGTTTGAGTVAYTVANNDNNTPRSGTISVAGQSFIVWQGAQFNDVPLDHPFYTFIGKLSARGITQGCGGGNFCPDANVTRAQMAIFIERSLGVFTPPPGPITPTFAEVPNSGATDYSYEFIEDSVARGIMSDCDAGPPRLFCPTTDVTREQIAIFILRALGVFTPPPGPMTLTFADVPNSGATDYSYEFIEEFCARGITNGCAAGPPRLYCPTANVTRGQMAVFLVRAFNL